MKLRWPYAVLLLVYAVSRIGYYLLGVRMDARPVKTFFQFIDPELLRHRLMESVFYAHAQPAGFNLYAGIILKLFPERYGAAFHAIHLCLGAEICCLLYFLMRSCGVASWLALVLTCIFSVSPGVVLFENFVTVEYLVVFLLLAAAASLYLFARDGKLSQSVAFFASTGLLALARNHFHLIYLAMVFFALLYVLKQHRRAVCLAGIAPLLLVSGLYLKNWILFGTFSYSTWMGLNLDVITSHQLTPEEARGFVEGGSISPVSLVDLGAPIASYKPYVRVPAKTGIPVLDLEVTSTGVTNFDNPVFFEIQRYYVRDGLWLLRHYPVVYLRSLKKAWFAYFLPTGDFPYFEQNRPRIFGLDRFFNVVFFGQFKDASDRKELARLEAGGSKLGLVLYTGIFLLAGLPLLWLRSIYAVCTGVREKRIDQPTAILLSFLLFNITYLTAVANFLSSFENNRYRFQVDAFYVVLLGLGLNQLRRRLGRKQRTGEASYGAR